MLEIVPYRESWPAEFRKISSRQRDGLGDLVLHIDHIRWAAVIGLSAKDVIEIQITANSLDPLLIAALGSLGNTQVEGIRREHRLSDASGKDPASGAAHTRYQRACPCPT